MRGLWRGTGPTVVRLSLGAGINFVVLEKLKHLMLEHLPRTAGQLDWLQAALVGGELDSTSLLATPQQLLMHVTRTHLFSTFAGLGQPVSNDVMAPGPVGSVAVLMHTVREKGFIVQGSACITVPTTLAWCTLQACLAPCQLPPCHR